MDGCAWPVRSHCPRRLMQVLDLCSRRGEPRPASEDAVLYKTTGSRNLPEHQTQIRRCSHGRSIRQNVPQGILDGLRLICITTMAGCGLCSPEEYGPPDPVLCCFPKMCKYQVPWNSIFLSVISWVLQDFSLKSCRSCRKCLRICRF